jgi:hypothetical protein
MPRFVVLEHELPADANRGRHWDLMLETDQALTTWAISQPPDTPCDIDALALPDHRLAYLDYEGPVSGNRGTVTRWDRGGYEMLERASGVTRVRLDGTRLRGVATLKTDDAQRVSFSFEPEGSTA